MGQKLKWGILSTAGIGEKHVIPAMQKGTRTLVEAVASRNAEKASAFAKKMGIPRSFDSYEGMLLDGDIDAVYIPLPNHLHSDWAIRCMEAGKHVLVEKPLALNIPDIKKLIAARDRCSVFAAEAFMVHSHPQFDKAREIIDSGELGEILSAQAFFGYYNVDPQNIRNNADIGGGALWDIGCYPIHVSRMILGSEADSVNAFIDKDPRFGTDRNTAVTMKFGDVLSSFIVSTQSSNKQFFSIQGSKANLEIEIPYNAPADKPTKLILSRGDIQRNNWEVIEVEACNQYTLQADDFAASVYDGQPIKVPFEDSLMNTATILAAFKAAQTRAAVSPAEFLS